LARCGASGVPDEDFGHQRSLVLVKPALPDSLPRRSTRTVHAGRSRPPKWVRDRPVERSSNRTPMRVVPVSGLLAGHGARFALRSLANASHGTPSSETLCSRRRPGHPEDPADSPAARGSGSAPIARCARCRRGRDAPAAPANTGQCQPPSPSCPVRCDEPRYLRPGLHCRPQPYAWSRAL